MAASLYCQGLGPLPSRKLQMCWAVFHFLPPGAIWRAGLYPGWDPHHEARGTVCAGASADSFPALFDHDLEDGNVRTCQCGVLSLLHPSHRQLFPSCSNKATSDRPADFPINCHCMRICSFALLEYSGGINDTVEWLLWRFMWGSREVCFLSFYFFPP